jgi:hypothetical protein
VRQGQHDAVGGEVIAACAGDAKLAEHAQRGNATKGLARRPRKDTETHQHDHGHAAVGHQVRRNPERVAADQQVPADVPARAPDRDEVGGEERPEASAGDS